MQTHVVQGVPVAFDVNNRASSIDQYTSNISLYSVKHGTFGGAKVPYLLQGANGPCPLLAICNILLLNETMSLEKDSKDVEFETLIQRVANILIERSTVRHDSHAAVLDESIGILGNLNKGMDVNIRFTSVDAFDHTKETAVLYLLGIRLFHAWIVSEDDFTVFPYLSPLSYNEAVEKVAHYEEIKTKAVESGDFDSAAANSDTVHTGETIAQWLHATSSQITSDGIIDVNSKMKDNELAMLFRNNHFAVICKKEDRLFALVTDVGFTKTNIMWESLDQLDGDVAYFDSSFLPIGNSAPESDYEMALRLQYGSPAAVPGIVVPQPVVARPNKKKNACACTIM